MSGPAALRYVGWRATDWAALAPSAFERKPHDQNDGDPYLEAPCTVCGESTWQRASLKHLPLVCWPCAGGVPIVGRGFSRAERDRLIERRWQEGAAVEDIAREVGMSRSGVWHALTRLRKRDDFSVPSRPRDWQLCGGNGR